MSSYPQSVEHESPQALEYLRTDCHNVNTFFRKQGVTTLTLREFFEWVVNPSLPAPDDPASHVYLHQLLEAAQARGFNETVEMEDSAFRYVHIPRHLHAAYPFVRDFLRLQTGKLTPSEVYYAAVSGMKQDLSGAQPEPDPPRLGASNREGNPITFSGSTSENEIDNGDSEDEVMQHRSETKKSQARPRNESPESRKLRKKAVKEQQSQRRKTKIPKHIKRNRTKK